MPLSKKRKVAADFDDEPAQTPHIEAEPAGQAPDTTNTTQERRERFKALQARAVSTRPLNRDVATNVRRKNRRNGT